MWMHCAEGGEESCRWYEFGRVVFELVFESAYSPQAVSIGSLARAFQTYRLAHLLSICRLLTKPWLQRK